MMHLGSRYTLSLPAPELNDDLCRNLVYNVIRSIKECGLTGKAVTFRLDNEASLVSLVDLLSSPMLLQGIALKAKVVLRNRWTL